MTHPWESNVAHSVSAAMYRECSGLRAFCYVATTPEQRTRFGHLLSIALLVISWRRMVVKVGRFSHPPSGRAPIEDVSDVTVPPLVGERRYLQYTI